MAGATVRIGGRRGAVRPRAHGVPACSFCRTSRRSTCRSSRRRSRLLPDSIDTKPWGGNLTKTADAPGSGWRPDRRSHAPPFLMLGVSLQNTTTDDFAFQLAARYLAFDVFGSGSELRMDGTAGAEPSVFAELYRPFGRTPLFVVGTAGARRETLSFVSEDIVTARYNEDSGRCRTCGGCEPRTRQRRAARRVAGRPERERPGWQSRPPGAQRT